MNFTVLGASCAWSKPGQPTSGYLLQTATTSILVDCGHGVLGQLRLTLEPEKLDAVVLSHLHMDHVADLMSMSWYLQLHPHSRPGHRPRLIVPAGETQRLTAIASAFGHADAYSSGFLIEEQAPGTPVQVGDVTVNAAWVPHGERSLALDFAHEGRRITYGGDCKYNQALIDLAQGTDLLAAEATMPPGTDAAQ